MKCHSTGGCVKSATHIILDDVDFYGRFCLEHAKIEYDRQMEDYRYRIKHLMDRKDSVRMLDINGRIINIEDK